MVGVERNIVINGRECDLMKREEVVWVRNMG